MVTTEKLWGKVTEEMGAPKYVVTILSAPQAPCVVGVGPMSVMVNVSVVVIVKVIIEVLVNDKVAREIRVINWYTCGRGCVSVCNCLSHNRS